MEETKDINNDIKHLLKSGSEDDFRYYLSGKSVYELAHLAKNIIQMVSGSVEIMQLGLERKDYDRVRKSWELFHPNFIRLKEFLLDLIKYTKHYPIHKSTCNLNDLVRKAIRSCEYLLKKHPVKINLRIDKQVPELVVDPDRIQEAISNLVIHAMDNLEEHKGEINIEITLVPDRHHVQFTISDNGPILTEDVIQSVCEPYERTRNMCGTGFDIPLANIYIEQHDGYMEFESTPETGNQIRVFLPVI